MWQSVIDAFTDFSIKFEGKSNWPYLDTKCLLTVGVGNLIDPVSTAINLPWVLPNGSTPSHEVIIAQLNDLKAQPRLAKLHYRYAAAVTTIRLTDEGIAQLVQAKLLANAEYLTKTFTDFASRPADFQLFASSLAWAVGPGWPKIFGTCTRLLLAGKYDLAATQPTGADGKPQYAACEMNEAGNPGLRPRNIANRLCLHNAGSAVAQGLPLSQLYWPGAAPNANDRDAELQREASLALANMPALDLSHDADSSAAFFDDEEPDTNPINPKANS